MKAPFEPPRPAHSTRWRGKDVEFGPEAPRLKPLRVVQAGGIIRTALDNTWQTPPKIIDPARDIYFQGEIPFDAATALSNPTRARRFCAGRLDWHPADATDLEVASAKDKPRRSFAALGRGADIRLGLSEWAEVGLPDWHGEGLIDERVVEASRAVRRGDMPFCSGLEVSWDWPTWINPPYGRELKKWLAKIGSEAARGTDVVGLLPCARWEQVYFQKVLALASCVLLIRSRVAFISSIDNVPVGGNPYASMLIGWNTNRNRWLDAFGKLGCSLDVKRTRRRIVRPIVPCACCARPLVGVRSALAPGVCFDCEKTVPLFDGVLGDLRRSGT